MIPLSILAPVRLMITFFPSDSSALHRIALVVVLPFVPIVTMVFPLTCCAIAFKMSGSIRRATYPGRVTPLPRFIFLIRKLVSFAALIASLLLNLIVHTNFLSFL